MELDFSPLQQVSPATGPINGTAKLTPSPRVGAYTQGTAFSLPALEPTAEFNSGPETTPSTCTVGWAPPVTPAAAVLWRRC